VRFAIRRVTPDEASRLGAFATELFRVSYGPTHPEPTLGRYLVECFGPEEMRRRLEDAGRTFLVVESEPGDWLGYAELHREAWDPERATLTLPLPGTAAMEIVRFYVAPEHHGRGVAQSLMRACEAVARESGCDVLWLQAWQEAAQALRFYEKQGFTRHGTAVFRFGDRLDHDYLLARPIVTPDARPQ
jgi:ribosomal protein S18 acetylase RimI-like enzyme